MGRWKAQIQLWLTAVVINIKRAVRALSQTESVAGGQKASNIAGTFADAAKEIARVMHRIFLLTEVLRQQSLLKIHSSPI